MKIKIDSFKAEVDKLTKEKRAVEKDLEAEKLKTNEIQTKNA